MVASAEPTRLTWWPLYTARPRKVYRRCLSAFCNSQVAVARERAYLGTDKETHRRTIRVSPYKATRGWRGES